MIVWPLMLLWVPFVPAMKEYTKKRELRVEECRRLMGERDAILKAAAEKRCPGISLEKAGKGGRERAPPKVDGEPPPIPDTSKDLGH